MKCTVLLLTAFVATSTALAADWPAYRGATGNGIASESLPGTEWGDGPEELWKVEADLGFSSFSVADGKAATLEMRDVDGNPMEVCVLRNADDGSEIWVSELWIAGKWNGGGGSGEDDNKGGDGPRSTPVIQDGKVYVIDSHIRTYALDLETGEQVWSRNIEREHGGRNIKWMSAAAPLVADGKLFLAGGGADESLIALDADSGETIWAVGDHMMTHATPVMADLLDQQQVIFFTQTGLISTNPDSGEELWRYEFPFNVSTAASPVVWEDIVYCSAGYGVGAGAVKISRDGDGFSAEEIWRAENSLPNHWSTPVVKDGFLYGMFSFKEYGKGPLSCVDIRTGEQKWAEAGYGPGNVILAGEHLVALSDRGELAIVEASPEGYEELARQDLLAGKCWSTPALADGVVYIRSTEEGGAFRLP